MPQVSDRTRIERDRKPAVAAAARVGRAAPIADTSGNGDAMRPDRPLKPGEEGYLYAALSPRAHEVKSALQMLIGVGTVAALTIHFALDLGHLDPLRAVTKTLLGGIGVGLSASAVVELAYTLFTPGPDEALNPLMLGVAAALLFVLGGVDRDTLTVGTAAALLLLGLLLATLFLTRLLLAESSDLPTHIWWIRRMLGLKPQVDPTEEPAARERDTLSGRQPGSVDP
jgi:hypothetical protein